MTSIASNLTGKPFSGLAAGTPKNEPVSRLVSFRMIYGADVSAKSCGPKRSVLYVPALRPDTVTASGSAQASPSAGTAVFNLTLMALPRSRVTIYFAISSPTKGRTPTANACDNVICRTTESHTEPKL